MQPSGTAEPQLPELVDNPLASIRPGDIEVQAAGRWILIPAMTAADWLELLMGDVETLDLDAVFPGLASEEDQDFINEALIRGDISPEQVDKLALQLVSEASGRSWYVTLRLIHIAMSRWSILGGRLILTGLNPQHVSLSAWLDALWLTMFDSLPKDKWTMFSSQLEMPPPSEAKPAMESMEMSADAFTSLMHG